MRRARSTPFVLSALLGLSLNLLHAEDWPHWRGPMRAGATQETSGWDEGAWPLAEAWSAKLGNGSSSVLVVENKVYAFGNRGNGETVFCLDGSNGKVLWEQNYPAPDYERHSTGHKNFYIGPSATPEFDTEQSLLFTLGGGFTVSGDTKTLCEEFKKAGGLTLEIIFTAADNDQSGPARILTFSECAHSRNVTLGQEKDALVLRLRTPATGDNGIAPETILSRIEAGKPYHCLVSYGNGTLASYLNGAQVYKETGRVTGDFSNWTAQDLLVGDEWDANRPWKGRVEGFALYGAATIATAAVKRFKETARP